MSYSSKSILLVMLEAIIINTVPFDPLKHTFRGVLISGMNLYYKAQFGTFVSVLNTHLGVSSFQG